MTPLLKQLHEKAEHLRRKIDREPENHWLFDVLEEVEEEIERLEDGDNG